MNKNEFIDLIASKNNLSKKQAGEVVSTFTDAVTQALSTGESVQLIGFGSFGVTEISAREGRNPQTGASMKIAAHKRPGFRAGQKLKQAVNR